MKTLDMYKQHVKSSDPSLAKDLAYIEEQAAIISEIIKQRNELGLSQRDLAALCGIPQSSVARIESFKTTPNISTLINIFKHLGLSLTVTEMN